MESVTIHTPPSTGLFRKTLHLRLSEECSSINSPQSKEIVNSPACICGGFDS